MVVPRVSCTKKICEFMKFYAILLNVRKGLVANLILLVERSEERLNNVTNLIIKKENVMNSYIDLGKES